MLVRRELKVHKVDVEKSIDAIYLNHPFELMVIDPVNDVITFTV